MGTVKSVETIKMNSENLKAMNNTNTTEPIKNVDTINIGEEETIELEAMSATKKVKPDSDFINIDYINADLAAIPTLWNLSVEQIQILANYLIENFDTSTTVQIAYKNGELAIKTSTKYDVENGYRIHVYDRKGNLKEIDHYIENERYITENDGIPAKSYLYIEKKDSNGQTYKEQQIYKLTNGYTYETVALGARGDKDRKVYMTYYDPNGYIYSQYIPEKDVWIDANGREIEDYYPH